MFCIVSICANLSASSLLIALDHAIQSYSVGVFKGEPVFLQMHKETLRTKLQWRRMLRQVRQGEEPTRLVKRQLQTRANGNSSSSGGGGENSDNGTIELKLFGSWQTEQIRVRFFYI